MLSKTIWIIALLLCNIVLSACSVSVDSEQFIIGKKLENTSSVSVNGTEDVKKVAVYDKTVKRIHQFDITKMEHLGSYAVENTQVPHYVLSDIDGRYIVDLSKKGFSIISPIGTVTKDPVTLQGTPVSAAFRPDLGILLIYDDLNNVALLKISADGSVTSNQKVLLGSYLVNAANITAGDIADNGKLILSLSDDSIAVVDIEQTLQQRKWIFTNFTTTLKEISWVAPIPGNPDQVLLISRSAVALLNVQTQTILSKVDALYGSVLKASKDIDPHVIVNTGNDTTMYFVSGGTIQSRTRYLQSKNILSSYLDIANDRWSLLDSQDQPLTIFNDPNANDKTKEFKNFRLSDMLALTTQTLPGKAHLQISRNFILGLFPSELGYAVRYDIDRDYNKELKYFNMKHIK